MYITIVKTSKISGWRTPVTHAVVEIGKATAISDFEGQEAMRQRGFIQECDKDGNIIREDDKKTPEVKSEPEKEEPYPVKQVIDTTTVTRRGRRRRE